MNNQFNVGIFSPSFEAPAIWPNLYLLGKNLLKDTLSPYHIVEGEGIATANDRIENKIRDWNCMSTLDLVFTTLGGNCGAKYANNLNLENFNGKFFGFSDCTHYHNQLWLAGKKSYYGCSIMNQFALSEGMDTYTKKYFNHAVKSNKNIEILPSTVFCDTDLNWGEVDKMLSLGELAKIPARNFEINPGYKWDCDDKACVTGVSWGGCLESIEQMIDNKSPLPKTLKGVILVIETANTPRMEYIVNVIEKINRVLPLSEVLGVLVGRPKVSQIGKVVKYDDKLEYYNNQIKSIIQCFRKFNSKAPIVFGLDFGHTNPQVCIPLNSSITIDCINKKVIADF